MDAIDVFDANSVKKAGIICKINNRISFRLFVKLLSWEPIH
jgi:hypothetical protein